MKKPSILNGIVVAFILTVVMIPCAMILHVFIHPYIVAKLKITILSGIYGFYLILRREARVGRLTLGVGLTAALVLGMLLKLSFYEHLLISLGLIWVVRSLLNYRSIISVALDGALLVLGLGCSMWAFFISGSFLSAIWCFFLTQALFTLIPRKFQGENKAATFSIHNVTDRNADRFSRAYAVAEKAIVAIVRT